MADNSDIFKAIDKKIRASLAYSEWVKRNRTIACTAIGCTETKGLEVHHMVDLYHHILGLWKYYGDAEATFQHLVMYHQMDICEGICLCKSCHTKRHPLRPLNSYGIANTDLWCTIPRMLKVDPNHSTMTPRKGSVGLIAYQTILGIGWNLMNGHVESRMLSLHRRNFAKLLYKTPGSSFNTSLDIALQQLQEIGVLDAYHLQKTDVELYISNQYFDLLADNPWFFPLKEIKTNSMCVLCLRLWLGMQANRHLYNISLEKLQGHIGMTIKHRYRAILAIQKALKQIPWAKMEDNESLQFTMGKRYPTPIRTLRTILDDCLQQAK